MNTVEISKKGAVKKNRNIDKFLNDIWRNRVLYLFILPAVVAVIVFSYQPMYGVIIAFQKYEILKGISGSQFIGLDNFKSFLSDADFGRALRNTVAVSLLTISIVFPLPILFAILINETRWDRFKKITQSITYLPHFISWVIVSGLVYKMLDQDTGIINAVISGMGFDTIGFLREPKYFWGMYLLSKIWKELGWSSILYLSAMTAINPELYEAATVDGAGRFKRIWHITLPGILPTVVVLLILEVSNFFKASGGFEAILSLRNPMLSQTSDIIDVFNYFKGVKMAQYGYATAVGLTQSVLSIILLFTANKGMKKLTGHSLF